MSDLQFTLSHIDALKQRFDPALVDKALNTSINRTAEQVRTLVSKDVRSYYNVKTDPVNKALSFKRASMGTNQAMLVYAGKKIGLQHFGARERAVKVQTRAWGNKRQQVRVKVRKSDALTPAESGSGMPGFLAKGLIFARQSAARTPLLKLAGPAVAQMVSTKPLLDKVDALVADKLPQEFERNLSYFLGKQVGLY